MCLQCQKDVFHNVAVVAVACCMATERHLPSNAKVLWLKTHLDARNKWSQNHGYADARILTLGDSPLQDYVFLIDPCSAQSLLHDWLPLASVQGNACSSDVAARLPGLAHRAAGVSVLAKQIIQAPHVSKTRPCRCTTSAVPSFPRTCSRARLPQVMPPRCVDDGVSRLPSSCSFACTIGQVRS